MVAARRLRARSHLALPVFVLEILDSDFRNHSIYNICAGAMIALQPESFLCTSPTQWNKTV